MYRFNSQPHLGLKAIYDLHYRASYELYADVLLVSIHHQCYQYNLQKRECYMIESSLTSQILSCLEIMRQSSQDCNTNSKQKLSERHFCIEQVLHKSDIEF